MTKKKPLIALTPYFNIERDEPYMRPAYLKAIRAAGGTPLILPLDLEDEDLQQVVDTFDGFLFTGGPDIHPFFFGEETQENCGNVCLRRDRMEMALLKLVMKTGKPVLGICRGIQIMNVAAGGTLYQDLEIEGKFEHHFGDKYPRNYPWHDLTIEKGSILEKIYGKTEIRINSFHHQAVKDPGKDIEIIAKSADGVPEAIVQKNHPFSVAVQWHPEMMYDSDEQLKLLKAFVDACR